MTDKNGTGTVPDKILYYLPYTPFLSLHFTTRLIPDCDSSSTFAAQRSTFTALVRAGPAPRRNPFSPQSEGQVSMGHAD